MITRGLGTSRLITQGYIIGLLLVVSQYITATAGTFYISARGVVLSLKERFVVFAVVAALQSMVRSMQFSIKERFVEVVLFGRSALFDSKLRSVHLSPTQQQSSISTRNTNTNLKPASAFREFKSSHGRSSKVNPTKQSNKLPQRSRKTP